jgi:lysozyme
MIYTASDNAINILKKLELFRSTVYSDAGGKPTIGYGTLIDTVAERQYLDKVITKEEAEQLLRADVKQFEKEIAGTITKSLTQGQYDAILLFVYNVGSPHFRTSGLRAQLNKDPNDLDRIRIELLKWTMVDHISKRGLVNRRMREFAIYKANTVNPTTGGGPISASSVPQITKQADNTPQSSVISKDIEIRGTLISGAHDTQVVFDPEVVLENISIFDKGGVEKDEITENKAGTYSPLIKINDMSFQGSDINYIIISYSDTIPKISLQITDLSGNFTTRKSIPKDGDIISVYVKSENVDIKPIRQDFRIISSKKIGGGDGNGDIGRYSISGILHIPINNNDELCIVDKTSCDALQVVAKELRLGFATNENATSDVMNWLNPMKDRVWFMEYIANRSYKNDDTFFVSFVDQWYYLNFIEINKKLESQELDIGTVAYLTGTDYQLGDNEQKDKLVKSQIFLSNSPVVSNTAMHIGAFSPFNNTGQFWAENGYMNDIMYYRKDERVETEYYIDSVVGKVHTGVPMKGRTDEDHTKIKQYKYEGIQTNSNVHKNYLHAGVQNKFNVDNVNKMGLSVETSYPNLQIHKYDTIPVFILNLTNEHKARNEGQVELISKSKEGKDDDPANYRLDTVLSGFYIVSDIRYKYTNGRYNTSYTLVKREWDV